MNIVPVVEPLTTPEGDLRSALDDILHLKVALDKSGTPAIVFEVGSDLFVDAIEELQGHLDPCINHVGIISQHVIQDRAGLHIEVVFVTKTLCFPKLTSGVLKLNV